MWLLPLYLHVNLKSDDDVVNCQLVAVTADLCFDLTANMQCYKVALI